MKKRILFSLMALFMLSLVLVSCKDDDDNSNAETAILGKWKSQSEVLYVDGKQDDKETFIATDDEYVICEFKSDGTAVVSEVTDGKLDDDSYTYKYSISGNKITTTVTCTDREGNYRENVQECTFSINGNTLVLTTIEETAEGHTYKTVATYVKM